MKVYKITGRKTKAINVESIYDFQQFMDAISTSLYNRKY